MNRTENISIGRRGFVCDQDAYKVIADYLKRAEHRLNGDPDKDEILADLELSMAGHLSELSGDLVVDKPTAVRVVEMMGEVTAPEPGAEENNEMPTEDVPFQDRLKAMLKKPLFKDHERAIIDGVCAGIARSLAIDPVWVRLVFVLLLFITQGFMGVVYILLIVIMKEPPKSKKKTASEVVDGIKDKVAASMEAQRPYEQALRGFFVGLFRVVWVTLQVLVCVLLVTVAIAWASVFFTLGTNDVTEILGGKPGVLEYIFISSIGLVLLIPLYELLSAMIRPRPTRSRTTLLLWSLWALSFIAAVGSGINIAPKTLDYLKSEAPDNRFVRVQMVGDEIASLCISPFGTCSDPEQVLSYEKLCGREVTIYIKEDRPVWLERGWSTLMKSLEYPVSEDAYCQEVLRLIGIYGTDDIMFARQTLNDRAYVSREEIVQNQGVPNTAVPSDREWWEMEYLTRF